MSLNRRLRPTLTPFAMTDLPPPDRCVVLVPCHRHIEPDCETGLRALERAGYPVRRVPGYSAVDLARCTLAADALRDGFDELLWVDSDVAFDPADVGRLRGHGLPLVCGLYPCKAQRRLACEFLPGTDRVEFGPKGGLLEVQYAGFGFMLTSREVYDRLRDHLELPEANRQFGRPLFPWFLPTLVPTPAGYWYLGEDYAFCERARQCGFRIVADTTVRLWHVGAYGYSWEDAGAGKDRFASYTYHLRPTRAGGSNLAQPPQP
jgi:hypothetical protein